ncbi:hypothetical protein PILCRDRAFT_817291 [Piloderma croceum F 1598]|uniref:YDG domain-containing protein n=1 Tax=Piloderma croceum (strain F 1598) TaxID=765440 RepID=A0A0C3FMH3_PILCF|nr:hypothetical protein PILCRDRAFT_817291 [Piloderma croceum F 1598]
MPKLSQYEIEREENIKRNSALLDALGIQKVHPKEVPKPKKAVPPKKRKAEVDENNDASAGSPPKIARTTSSDQPLSGARRSARNAGKKVDYKAEQIRVIPVPISTRNKAGNAGPLGSGASGRKIVKFGSIPDIEVGTWWQTREDCSNDSIHAPWVGGISGSKHKGAYSIALSGGYDDDVDLGYGFTFTGAGGRDLKGTKTKPKNLRTAPQSCDQTFENNGNAALKKSSETGKPVRVIRGFKNKSEFAPSEGYRYDGLYTVEKAWMEKGLNPGGFLVCKFAFKRIADQPPLPVRDLDAEAAVKNQAKDGGNDAQNDEESDEDEDEDEDEDDDEDEDADADGEAEAEIEGEEPEEQG